MDCAVRLARRRPNPRMERNMIISMAMAVMTIDHDHHDDAYSLADGEDDANDDGGHGGDDD